MTNCRCDVSAFDLQDRCVDFRRSMWRLCVDRRRSMCCRSKIDDRSVDLRRSVIDVSTFEDRWSMCRPSNIDHYYSLYANYAEALQFSAFIILVLEQIPATLPLPLSPPSLLPSLPITPLLTSTPHPFTLSILTTTSLPQGITRSTLPRTLLNHRCYTSVYHIYIII